MKQRFTILLQAIIMFIMMIPLGTIGSLLWAITGEKKFTAFYWMEYLINKIDE